MTDELLEPEDDFESIFEPKPRENPVYIDDLADAIDRSDPRLPVLLVKPGELVVIERWFQGRWLGTALYKLLDVNLQTGDMRLHDEENSQAAMANYVTAPRHGWRFKLPVKGLSLHRREPPKQPTKAAPEPQKERVEGNGEAPTKKVGRPKGSKNRAPEVIAAANSAKFAERRRRREEREARRAQRKAGLT